MQMRRNIYVDKDEDVDVNADEDENRMANRGFPLRSGGF